MSAQSDDSTQFSLTNLDTDCLFHLLTLLPLPDALHLGLTCRRLFSLFEETRRTTKALALTSFGPKAIPEGIFKRTIRCPVANDSKEEEEEEEEFSTKLVSFSLSRHTEGCYYEQIPLAITAKFIDTYVNLRTLELASTFKPEDLTLLFSTQLTQSALPRLTTLKLSLKFVEILYNQNNPDYFWAPLATLVHPTLRHLTLILLNRRSIFWSNSFEHNRVYYRPLAILPQLASFSFFRDGGELPLIEQLTWDLSQHAPHLTPGGGARFGLRVLLVNYNVRRVKLAEELLPYLTYLELQLYWIALIRKPSLYRRAVNGVLRSLPAMRHLAKVDLRVIGGGENAVDYAAFLCAISSLEHLAELTLDVHEDHAFGNGTLIWPLTSLPVLASVRVLSLRYGTPNHTDVVEQFRLVHVFPGLRTLKCHFEQQWCTHCGYRSKVTNAHLPLFQVCGGKLVRGLLELPATVLRKKLSFTFITSQYHFKSLEDLLSAQCKN